MVICSIGSFITVSVIGLGLGKWEREACMAFSEDMGLGHFIVHTHHEALFMALFL
jgi:hypothetical protein